MPSLSRNDPSALLNRLTPALFFPSLPLPPASRARALSLSLALLRSCLSFDTRSSRLVWPRCLPPRCPAAHAHARLSTEAIPPHRRTHAHEKKTYSTLASIAIVRPLCMMLRTPPSPLPSAIQSLSSLSPLSRSRSLSLTVSASTRRTRSCTSMRRRATPVRAHIFMYICVCVCACVRVSVSVCVYACVIVCMCVRADERLLIFSPLSNSSQRRRMRLPPPPPLGKLGLPAPHPHLPLVTHARDYSSHGILTCMFRPRAPSSAPSVHACLHHLPPPAFFHLTLSLCFFFWEGGFARRHTHTHTCLYTSTPFTRVHTSTFSFFSNVFAPHVAACLRRRRRFASPVSPPPPLDLSLALFRFFFLLLFFFLFVARPWQLRNQQGVATGVRHSPKKNILWCVDNVVRAKGRDPLSRGIYFLLAAFVRSSSLLGCAPVAHSQALRRERLSPFFFIGFFSFWSSCLFFAAVGFRLLGSEAPVRVPSVPHDGKPAIGQTSDRKNHRQQRRCSGNCDEPSRLHSGHQLHSG